MSCVVFRVGCVVVMWCCLWCFLMCWVGLVGVLVGGY